MAALLPLIVLVATPAGALDQPALDDFYERTRRRGEGLEACSALCEGDLLLELLLGTQVANPSTDRLRPALAEGTRLGADVGWAFNRWSVTRTRAFADLLRVQETGDSITDLTLTHTTFYSSAERRYDEALHLSLDAVLASRSELQPSDFAELRLEPYRIADVEAEIGGVGPRIDKGGNLGAFLGTGYRRRWTGEGQALSSRLSVSGVVALRGFPHLMDTPDRNRGRHDQLDLGRLTWMRWQTLAGEAQAWRVSLGYQRLSPGIPGFEIWLLLGYGWHDGAGDPSGGPSGDPSGWLAQTGVEQRVGEAHRIGLAYDAWFTLDERTRRFSRVHNPRLTWGWDAGPLSAGLAYGYVTVEDAGRLHTLTGRLSWHPAWAHGFGLGARYRLAAAADLPTGAPDSDRYNVSLDWLL